jgi:cytoskeletal protein CcmA (bactofilin family)
MFSKNKPAELVPEPSALPLGRATDRLDAESGSASLPASATPPAKPKPAPSLLSCDLTIVGNVRSSGDIQIEGTIEGDIHAHMLTVGEGATVKGEIVADDVVVNGRVLGRLRGTKVRLSATARVEGDIIHRTIAIESGAHFEGSVQRQEDPTGSGAREPARISGPAPAAAAE